MSVTLRKEDTVGYVELDHPPCDAIGRDMRAGLLEAVHWAEKTRLTRVILSGADGTFVPGADICAWDADLLEPHLPDVLTAIDESFVPWIAAIEGVALGGGAEIAMACRMRVMTPGAQIGLPEVSLGVIPGAGGTLRLPRLVGLEKALDMITTGKPIGADAALEAGLIHAIDDDPVAAGYLLNAEELGCVVPTWELPPPENDPNVILAAQKTIAAKAPKQIAPARAIEVIEAGLNMPFHEALSIERAAYVDLRRGDQAKALRHIFFAQRAASQPKERNAAPVALAHIAVVGGGTMGAGIAYALLNAGHTVTLLETDADGVLRAGENVEKTLGGNLKQGVLTEVQADACRANLTVTDDYAVAADATLAIEAASESMDVKHSVFAKLNAVLSPKAILASTTSCIDLDEIAAALPDPSRVLGLHFFAPAHITQLLEIVQGQATSDRALATGFALGKSLAKVPVVAGVCDGLIGDRILARYLEAAETVFMDGSTPWEVDEAMVAFGYAMGPFEAQDLSGLDIAHANRRRQDATRDPNRRYIPIVDRMVELGKLGRKTGAGWYRYPGNSGKVEDPIVADLALEESHFAGRIRTDYSAEEIRERLLLAMINEAADVLEEGIATSARDIDLVTVFGCGFPRWRGGLMCYADTFGVPAIIAKLDALAQEDPVVWKVSARLKRCAAEGRCLSEVAQ